MAIGYTERGTATFTDNSQSTSTLTKASVTIAAGSTVEVAVGYNGGDEVLTVTWNGTSLTQKKKSGTAGSGGLFGEKWVLQNCAGGTGSVVVTWDTATFGPPLTGTLGVVEVTGAATASYDKDNSAVGSSTSPSSGATAALSQNNELSVGVIVTAGPSTDTAGTWSNSYTAGQRAGDTTATSHATLSMGYLSITTGAATTAAKTGITSRPWRALVSTYKETVVVATRTPSMSIIGVG